MNHYSWLGAAAAALTTAGLGVLGSSVFTGDKTATVAGTLLFIVGGGLQAAYNFLHQHNGGS